MIELRNNTLEFSFPDVHPEAKLQIGFQRTLRIPDDGKDYPLPPGLGRFSIKHVDDFAKEVPQLWLEHGGVMGGGPKKLDNVLSSESIRK
jgi:hypothetical protein